MARFTNEEIQMLEAGRVPQTLTWHHHQEPGRMEMVDYFSIKQRVILEVEPFGVEVKQGEEGKLRKGFWR